MHKQTPINLSQHCHKDLMPSLGRGQRVFLRYKSDLRFFFHLLSCQRVPIDVLEKRMSFDLHTMQANAIFPVTNDSLQLQKRDPKKTTFTFL